ncbi:MAG: AmmeMemoRadiSam system protein A [Deltaproteobacteria bacterium]|nr:AmmeMemoRadiSam system protein A [Deltaproteobacteria bacterium]
MSICCAALMCHAPIVVPEIGGADADRCRTTTRAMQSVAEAVVAHVPKALVLVSPHAPRDRIRWGLVPSTRIEGSFARFGFPDVSVELPGGALQAAAVADCAARIGLECWAAPGADLDHGSLVPLTFLARAGWSGPTLIVSLPHPGADGEARMGEAIAEAARALGERWAMIASGDMSHRLAQGAPGGRHPLAREFDEEFVRRLDAGDYRAACAPDPEIRSIAAEDVVASTLVAASSVGFRNEGHAVFAYEGPFGVGYCEALLYTDGSGGAHRVFDDEAPPAALVDVARESIRAHAAMQRYAPDPLPSPWAGPRAVFVTLRSPDGALRGCIGRLAPRTGVLADEVADCAIDAATRDGRFVPVQLEEVASLRIEVSVLGDPEPVDGPDRLDPARFGVTVLSGDRCGVLLPGIDGVATPREQLAIACEKAGIAPGEPYAIERFTVRKVCS